MRAASFEWNSRLITVSGAPSYNLCFSRRTVCAKVELNVVFPCTGIAVARRALLNVSALLKRSAIRFHRLFPLLLLPTVRTMPRNIHVTIYYYHA